MKRILLLFLGFTTSGSLLGQLTISLPLVIESPGKQVEVLSEDFMTGEISKWGEFYKGEVSIKLELDYMDKVLQEAEKQKKDAPKGWTLSFHTVGSKHECSKYSNENTMTFENPDTKLFGLPPFFAANKKKKELYGSMYATSSVEMAAWLHNYQMGSATRGLYVEWIYVEKESEVKGTCSMLTMTGYENEEVEVSTTYDLNFKQGWNTVVYQIKEVFESASNISYVKEWNIYTTTLLPEKLKWFIIKD